MNTDNLVETRKFLGYTQEDVAELTGVDRTTYNHYEKGQFNIPIEKLNIISNEFNSSLDYLAGISRKNNENFEHIEITKESIGKNLRKVRKELGLTQEQLAKKLHTGQPTISAYENGKKITVLLLIDYAKVTEKSIDCLCGKAKK